MLNSPTPFPYVGSYALLVDRESAERHAAAELVRIQMRATHRSVGEDGGERDVAVAIVSFPLRGGASGNKRVPLADLIDATPLTATETREFHDLDRYFADRSARTPRQKARLRWRDALRQRTIWAPVAERLLREAAAAERKAA